MVFFRVVDRETKQPLPAVKLKVWINGKVESEQATDETGRIVIRLPSEEPESLSVAANRDGFTPINVYLRHRFAKETEIPRSYTLAMDRGTSIGGVVRDEEGRPIEGVSVSLLANNPDDSGREVFDFRSMMARTDRQGRWHVDLIPAGLDLERLHFTFSHPGFLNWTDLGTNSQPSAIKRREWLRIWSFTEAAREYRRARRSFAGDVALQPDGSFRVDEIQAGKYQLHVHVKGFHELICNLEIPAPGSGRIGAAVDVGVLTLKR